MTDSSSHEQIARAFGRIPSGVAILTAAHGEDATGMLASWFQQASFEPLMVSVCVKKGRPIEDLIQRSQAFVLNLLGEDPKEMVRHFGPGFAPGEEAFEGMETRRCETGVVLEDTLAVIECILAGTADAGDNILYLGQAVGGRVESDARPCVHLRKSGLNY